MELNIKLINVKIMKKYDLLYDAVINFSILKVGQAKIVV